MMKGDDVPGVADQKRRREEFLPHRRVREDFEQLVVHRPRKQPEHQSLDIGPGGINTHN
jgi:hypothetical protein